jgi:hypothetical protein
MLLPASACLPACALPAYQFQWVGESYIRRSLWMRQQEGWAGLLPPRCLSQECPQTGNSIMYRMK